MGEKIHSLVYNTDKLMIIAHADDEIIWGGEELMNAPGEWDILCITTPPPIATFRIPIFLNKVSAYLNINTTMLSFKDSGLHNIIEGNIEASIEEKIKSKEWAKIITHGAQGEYGHMHHKQVHRAVVSVMKKTDDLDILWTFNPKKNALGVLSEEKMKLFQKTYDDHPELSIDHPRRQHFRYNTTKGWQENIKKFS